MAPGVGIVHYIGVDNEATKARAILTAVSRSGSMDPEDLNGEWLALALAAGLVVELHGLIQPAKV